MTDNAAQRPAPKPKRGPPRRVTVSRVERLTPGLIRVTFEGPALAGFGPPRPAAHIKLFMLAPGADWNPLDETQRRPSPRTYTPRYFDPAKLTLDVDFVLHGEGLASNWVQRTKPGETAFIGGPGGGYDVPADARTLVIVADDTALPAVGMILDTLPPSCTPIVIAEVAGPQEERVLSDGSSAQPTWLHRDVLKAQPSALLEAAVRAFVPPAGPVHWWVACEAAAMRRIKQHLLNERGIDPALLHVRGYWKLGQAEYPDHDYGKD